MTTTIRKPNPGAVQVIRAKSSRSAATVRRQWTVDTQTPEFLTQASSGHLVPGTLRSFNREWRFGAASEWFRIGLITKASRGFSHEIAPQSFTNESVVVAGTTITCAWSVIAGDTSSVSATWSVASGELRCTAFSVTLDPAGTGATYAIGWVERGRFWHESPAADTERLVAVTPTWSGTVISDATAVPLTETRIPYPGQFAPYPDGVYGAPGAASAHGQYLGLVHARARVGIVHYALDVDGRGKLLRTTGDGAGCALTAIREYPADNLVALTWTPTYEVRLATIEGDEWTAAAHYGAAIKAAAPAWTTGRGKLRDNGTSPRPVPAWVHDVDHILWLTFATQGHTAFDATRRARLQEEITRWNTVYAGLNRAVWLQLTHWTGNPVEKMPDVAPIYADAASLISWITNVVGLRVVVYFGSWWGTATAWISGGYHAPYGDPLLVTVRDEDDVDVVADIHGTAFEMAYLVDWTQANGRNHAVDLVDTAINEAAPAAAVYWDAYAGGHNWNYRGTNPGSARGGGSSAIVAGMRTAAAAARAAIQAVVADGALWLEHFHEPLLDHGDVFLQPSETVGSLDTTTRWTPLLGCVWGGWAHLVGVNAYGTLDSSVGADYYEALRFAAALNVVAGRVPMLSTPDSVSDPTVNHLVLLPGDADWAAHGALSTLHHAFFRNLCVLRRTARKYLRGTMLPAPPESWFTALRDEGWAWGTTSDGLFIRPERQTGIMAVWTHDEDADNPIGLLLSNPLDVDQVFSITLDPSRFPLVGLRTIYRNDEGVRTELSRFAGVCRISFTVPAYGSQLLELGA